MTADILRLPTELQFRILDFADPSSHLPLALTCSTFHAVTRGVLRHHAQCHHLYRAQSDLLPLSILGLLRTSLRDPIAAWHVRDIEYWSMRRRWHDWTAHKLYREEWSAFPNSARHYQPHRDTWPVSFAAAGRKGLLYSDENELLHFRHILRSTFHLDEDSIFEWSSRITTGDEEPLRMLLLTTLPRLRSIKYMRSRAPLDDATQNPPYAPYDYPLVLMSHTIQRLCDLQVAVDRWPPALRSLQSIAFGIDIGLSRHLEPARPWFQLRLNSLVPLLALPSLKELYVPMMLAPMAGVFPCHPYCRSVNARAAFTQPVVEKLCLYNLGCPGAQSPSDYHILRTAIERAKNLKNFHNGGEFEHGDDLLDVLTACHASTLESLEIDCDMHRLLVTGELRRFSNLKHIVIHLEWLQGSPGPRKATGVYRLDIQKMDGIASLGDIFPASIVSVTFTGNAFTQWMSLDFERKLDELVAYTIRYRTLPNLKAVFLGTLLRITPSVPSADHECNLKWQRTLAAGRQGGVDIFGTGTHNHSYIMKRIRELGVTRFTSAGDVMTDPRRDLVAWRRRSAGAAKAALLCRIIRMSKEL